MWDADLFLCNFRPRAHCLEYHPSANLRAIVQLNFLALLSCMMTDRVTPSVVASWAVRALLRATRAA